MSHPSPEPAPAAKPGSPLIRALVDYAGPVAFVIGYFATKNFLTATWALVAVSFLALAVGYALERRIAPMPALAGGAALFFGLLTLVFKDATFLKMKPTFINLALGAVLIVGWLRGKSLLKLLLGETIKLSEPAWRRLTLHYGLFFLAVAGLNELVWRTQPEATWVLFRMPGLPLLAVVFSFTQVPGMMKDAKAAEAALRAAETQD
jgi:intracellular septation protein